MCGPINGRSHFERHFSLATYYYVVFQPSMGGNPLPEVAINSGKTTLTLPCLADPGSYTIMWALNGRPGETAPGLVTAVPIDDSSDTPNAGPSPPPRPMGFDRVTGLPIKVVNSMAQDVSCDYKLPSLETTAVPANAGNPSDIGQTKTSTAPPLVT